MKVTPISNPLEGERIVDVSPELKPDGIDTWQRRLNLQTGRTLSDIALSTEQTERAGRLTLLGQTVSPGVVTGLEVSLEAANSPNEAVFQISVGSGISASGEDITLPTAQRVRVQDLPVYAPVAMLNGSEGPFNPQPDGDENLLPRRLGAPLGQLDDAIASRLPPVSILVLQPVTAELVGQFDPEDPCEQDPQNDPFEDWQLVDGARLVLYPWATEVLTLPDSTEDALTWRNRLAHTIFVAEQALDLGQILPWESVGVPIALIGFADDRRTPLFADGYAVVRAGGKPRRRSLWLPNAGNPFLWQAQVQQFAEQLAEMDLAAIAIREAAQQFRFLPPVGVLPKNAVAIEIGSPPINQFFPPAYAMQVAPVPLEQLDVVMQASASLNPFDVQVADQVQILVPVPQVFYEPRLLEAEVISEEFVQTLTEFITRRARWLKRRQDVREIVAVVIKTIKGEPPTFPTPDPDALEAEIPAKDPIDPNIPELAEPEATYGTTVQSGQRTVDALEALRSQLRDTTPLIHETAVNVTPQFPASLQFPATISSKIRLDTATNPDRLIFQGAMSTTERDLLLSDPQLSTLPQATRQAFEQAIRQLSEQSQQDELSKLDVLGLEKFIEFLEDKVNRADDKIDLGFVRVQTDIYRLRQLMLGNLAASRLATSPALAAIAKGENAAATREDIQQFLESVKGRTVSDTPVPPPAAGSPGRVGIRPATTVTQPLVPLSRNVFVSGELSRKVSGSASIQASRTPLADTIGVAAIAQSDLIQAQAEPVTKRLDPGARFVLSQEALQDVRIAQPPLKAIQLQAASTAQLFQAAIAAPKAIVEDSAIIGKAFNFRTATVDERLKKSEALEAKSFTVASKFSVVSDVVNLDLAVDDLELPGFLEVTGEGNARQVREVTRNIRVIREQNLVGQILSDVHDPDPDDGDEAAFFAKGVRASENSIATLRVLEGRVQAYRLAIEACRKVLTELNQTVGKIDQRLKVIGDELAEARHDVAVARTLQAEEQARLDAINNRRQQILAEQVSFLVFHRPRSVDLRRELPRRTIDPGLVAAPVPACLDRNEPIPPELQEAADLLRDAPVQWFTHIPRLLEKLDHLEILLNTIQIARVRAQVPRVVQVATQQIAANPGLLPQAIHRTFIAQQQVVQRYRLETAQLNLSQFVGQSWLQTRDRAAEVLSLGDLIDGSHQRSQVAQQAARELEQMTQVAACLHAHFSEVLPAIRLNWAERLSQFDAPVNLRDLASLPRWGEIAILDRREMQTLADWLYQRVVADRAEAIALINDLVRICILLASHAPVNQIITGRVAQPTTVNPGGRVKLAIDPVRVRIGMQVRLYAADSQVVAQAIVEDLSANQASARITHAFQSNIQLQAESRVQFI